MLSVFFVLFVFPGLVGAVANASSGESQIDGISWMNVVDSQGVPLSSYRIVTDHGGVLAPYYTILWTILGLEVTGYLIFVGTAIWLIGYVLSFQWLNVIAAPLRAVADALSGQIATPIMLITAATVGAFCVAWFIVRGYAGKAATQVVTMLAVAVLGPMFLADPLAEVLSAHGWLAQGRDVGISVAAGLNGDAAPHPATLISSLQTTMVDNFARNPLQVWNFGHVIDDRPACRAAWSAGIAAGDDEQVRDGLRACDSAAYAKAENPSMGQIGTGVILLICAGLLLTFAVVLAVRIMKAAMDSIFHAFGAIFGFAAGGFVYGATQTHLIRSLVHSAVSAARMALYVIFLSLYMLIIGRIFTQAGGQVLSVFVIVGIVEVIAISQLKNLSNSLNQGNDWIANRFALAIQSGMSRAATGGSGSGTALGMGAAQAAGTVAGAGLGLVTTLTALNTLNTSPVTAWLANRTVNPLNPLSRARKTLELENMAMAPLSHEFQQYNDLGRKNWVLKALSRSKGEVTGLAAANVLDGLYDSKAPENLHAAIMLRAGFSHEQIAGAQQALAVQGASKMTDLDGVGAAQKAVAAAYATHNYSDTDSRDKWEPIAAQAVVAADNFARHSVTPTGPVDAAFMSRVRHAVAAPNPAVALAAITPDEWRDAGKDTRWAIGDEFAKEHRELARRYHDALVGKGTPGGPTAPMLRDQLFASASKISNLHEHLRPMGLIPWRH